MSCLKPAIVSGNIFTRGGDFDCEKENANGKVVAVTFHNIGSQSTAVIEYGGVQEYLLSDPTGKGEGGKIQIQMPTDYYDTTRYRISFRSGGSGQRVDRLMVSFIKEAKQG